MIIHSIVLVNHVLYTIHQIKPMSFAIVACLDESVNRGKQGLMKSSKTRAEVAFKAEDAELTVYIYK